MHMKGRKTRTIGDITLSGISGCPICKWLVLDMFQLNEEPAVDPANVDVELGIYVRENPLIWRQHQSKDHDHNESSLQLRYSANMEIDRNTRRARSMDVAEVVVELFAEDSPSIPISPYPPSANTCGDSTVHVTRQWISQCDSHHVRCRSRNVGAGPSRLIHLDKAANGSTQAKLVDSGIEYHTSDVKYVALSHRWLRGESLTLTVENSQSLHKSIPCEALKQSIEDAMVITMSLGVAHIWVDSLCIVQNDEQDKVLEITRMHQIYSQAYCTIVADSSMSMKAGCFNNRDPACVTSFRVSLPYGYDNEVTYRMRRMGKSNDRLDLARSVTTDRAWCYQERLLSRRLLRFCEMQVHWECRTLEASESHPHGRRDSLEQSLIRSPMAKSVAAEASDGAPQLQDQAFDFWRTVVEDYSGCNMTFDTDKLLALSAVVSFYQMQFGDDRYLWGIWAKHLPYALLWRVLPMHDRPNSAAESPFRRLANNIAPTWTWASVAARVRFNSRRHNLITAVVHQGHGQSEAAYAANPGQEVAANRLICLRAYIWRGNLQDTDTTGDPVQPGHSTTAMSDTGSLTVMLDCMVTFPLTVTYVPVQTRSRRADQANRWTSLIEEGIMLVPIPGRSSASYRRIGMYEKRYLHTAQYEPRGSEVVVCIE